jgi:nucleoid DNA-binding protein
VTRSELIKEVYDSLPPYYKVKFGLKGVRRVVDETFDSIIAATLQGEEVRIRNFASFRPQRRAPHRAFSGKARDVVMSKPYIKIVFSASKAWKRALANVLEQRKEKTNGD